MKDSSGPWAGDEHQVASLLAQAADAIETARPGDAEPALREAVARRPADARVHRDLGLAWLRLGRFADAIDSLRSALGLDQRLADAWLGLALAYERQGDVRSALTAYDRAASVDPSSAEAWYRCGALAHAMGRMDDALARFARAQEAAPDSAFGRLGAARTLLLQGRDSDAEQALREAVAIDPGNASAHDLLGHLQADWGRFEQARASFLHAVDLEPQLAGSWYDLVRCARVTPAQRGWLPRMDAALASPGLAAVQRQRVHLALGKAADDLGEPALAMRHFDAADALRPGSVAFDSAGFDRVVDRIIERCSPEAMARGMAGADASRAPILVLGMPRSGTTLVEQIIASHPAVAAGGELPFWSERGAIWHLDESAARDAGFLPRAAAQYLEMLRGIGGDAAHVTDKMPFNLLWAGAIHLALPNAIFVRCRRSPVDTALSIHQTMFHPNLQFPTGGANLVAYLRSIERLARHWRRVLPANRYLEVDHEDLTRDPEPQIRRLVAACGLPCDEACLAPHLNAGAVRTPSKWQARQPINRDSIERWRRYEPWLGELRALVDADLRAA